MDNSTGGSLIHTESHPGYKCQIFTTESATFPDSYRDQGSQTGQEVRLDLFFCALIFQTNPGLRGEFHRTPLKSIDNCEMLTLLALRSTSIGFVPRNFGGRLQLFLSPKSIFHYYLFVQIYFHTSNSEVTQSIHFLIR